ncbi:MAG: Gfo/Idh/MocA family oxidoreductase [Lachnospiraceae bacterium]|nr:Gfo/Idh/MocA family oxidoreductase [Lachnospiraceae bacterium]
MIRVGLIGCGGIGAVHAECWLAMKDKVRLVAVADMNEERAQKYADKAGGQMYRDGRELLENEELDVVDICVPTFLHADYLEWAMAKVKNVIVEKPVCLTEAETERILEAEKKSGALVQVAHVVRFTDAYAYLKKVVEDGTYGKVVAGDFARLSPRPTWMVGHDDVNRTGSMVLDLHIHDVDFVRYLMNGDPDSIQTSFVKDENGIVQHIWTSYKYGDVVLMAEGSWNYTAGMPFAQTFRVRLERATVVLGEDGALKVYPEQGGVILPEIGAKEEMDMGINVSDMGPYLNEIKYFIETIETQNYNGIVPLSEAIASFRLAKKEMELA